MTGIPPSNHLPPRPLAERFGRSRTNQCWNLQVFRSSEKGYWFKIKVGGRELADPPIYFDSLAIAIENGLGKVRSLTSAQGPIVDRRFRQQKK